MLQCYDYLDFIYDTLFSVTGAGVMKMHLRKNSILGNYSFCNVTL